MMYGGTAKSYCEYKLLGEPYKDGKVYYIKVESPKTGRVMTVRWYSDKAHHDLMPKRENPYGPMYKLFGFKNNTNNKIWCIKGKDITEDERAEYFGWQRGWRYGMFFGGIWYQAEGEGLPPIKNKERYFQVTWGEFRKAGQESSKKLGLVAERDSSWFNEEEK